MVPRSHKKNPYKKSKTTQQADEKRRRREEAEARHAAYEKVPYLDMIDRLDKMFGKGQGAARERARLLQKHSERIQSLPKNKG